MSLQDEQHKEQMFRFLDQLRRDGKINMFGAAVPLQKMYDLTRDEARRVHVEWMETFASRHPKG